MANSLVQFRTEESARIKASSICEKLGIDLPTYMRCAFQDSPRKRYPVHDES